MTDLQIPRPLAIQPEELAILQPSKRLTCSEYAEERVRLSSMTSSISGPWQHMYTPYLVEIMDSLSDFGTRQVTLVKCHQSGGSQAGMNWINWTIAQQPAPTLIVMPTEADTKRRVKSEKTQNRPSTPRTAGWRKLFWPLASRSQAPSSA